MKRFCTSCGKEIEPGAVFCTSCGAKNAFTVTPQQQQQNQQQNEQQNQQGFTMSAPASAPVSVSYPRPNMSTPGPVSYPRPQMAQNKKWPKIVVTLVVVAAVLALIGGGIWKAGEMTGLWHRMAVEREFGSWKKQKDLKSEQKAIFDVIEKMQAELQAGDVAGAMVYVHPDCREMLGGRFEANQDKLPLLISLMDDCELTYLSTDTGNYEALRMAIVQIGVPVKGAAAGTSAGMPDTGTARIVMVKSGDGWVVEDIS